MLIKQLSIFSPPNTVKNLLRKITSQPGIGPGTSRFSETSVLAILITKAWY